MGLFLLALAVLGAQSELARAQTDSEEATYTVTFKGNWNLDSTPGGVVGGAHFTTLIGAVHNSDVTFWAAGEMATAGVERVAELGATGTFESEVDSADAAVKSPVKGSGNISPASEEMFEVELSRSHPLLTLLSMIGPSPDWFVGVSGLSLLDESGTWRPSHTVDLFPYDAGTEDGEEFSLNNASTHPQGAITSLRGRGKFSGTPMAALNFTLDTVVPPPEEEEEQSDGSGDGGDGCAVGGSGSGGAFGLFLPAALPLAVSVRRTRRKTKHVKTSGDIVTEIRLREKAVSRDVFFSSEASPDSGFF